MAELVTHILDGSDEEAVKRIEEFLRQIEEENVQKQSQE